jgi:hypothetical protein
VHFSESGEGARGPEAAEGGAKASCGTPCDQCALAPTANPTMKTKPRWPAGLDVMLTYSSGWRVAHSCLAAGRED